MASPLLGYQYRLYNKQTKQEQALEKVVCKFGVRYRTQHLFMGQKAIVDFLFPDFSLVVEVDDPSHEENDKKAKDIERTNRLNTLGLDVLRFTNYEIDKRLSYVEETILLNLRKRGLPSSDDPPSLQSQPLPQSPSQEPLQLPAQPTRVKKGSRKRSR